jgi:hypothetical protein
VSTAPRLALAEGVLDSKRVEQRSERRYPIGLDVEFKLFNKGRVERVGTGKTLNVSSSGVCFQSADLLPDKGSIELVMNWPFMLEGVCPLRLVMRGRIVRREGQRTAIQVKHHEFRTAGIRRSWPPSAGDGGRSLTR